MLCVLLAASVTITVRKVRLELRVVVPVTKSNSQYKEI